MLGLGDFVANLPSYLSLTPSSVDTPSLSSSSGGFDWGSILTGAINTTESIFKAQYSTPQLAPGTYIQTNPNGASTAYRLPDNTASVGLSTFPGLTTNVNSYVLIGALGLGLILILKLAK